VNFYGYVVNQNGVVGEVVMHFDHYIEVKKRLDACKVSKFTAKTNNRKKCASDTLEVFKFPKFEPMMRGVANIKNKNTYYYYPCFAYSEKDETFEIALSEIYRADTN
jgi:hypothetical protein